MCRWCRFFPFFYRLVTLKHVARTVALVELDDNVISVVFAIFDENRKYIFREYDIKFITIFANLVVYAV